VRRVGRSPGRSVHGDLDNDRAAAPTARPWPLPTVSRRRRTLRLVPADLLRELDVTTIKKSVLYCQLILAAFISPAVPLHCQLAITDLTFSVVKVTLTKVNGNSKQ